MNSEEQMNMVEILSEELGEKELKIMALEKALEEQKKEKLEYYDLCHIKEQKLNRCEEVMKMDNFFTPEWVMENVDDGRIRDITLKHYFDGEIMTGAELINECRSEADCMVDGSLHYHMNIGYAGDNEDSTHRCIWADKDMWQREILEFVLRTLRENIEGAENIVCFGDEENEGILADDPRLKYYIQTDIMDFVQGM